MSRPLHITFSLLLLAAAYLKGAALLEAATGGSLSIPNAALGWFAVAAEGGLAVWLLSSIAPRMARRVTLGCLTIFVAVAGYKLARGDESCGCFGDVAVNPLWTLLADLGFLAAFAALRPGKSRAADSRRHGFVLAGVAAVALPVALLAAGIEANQAAAGRVTILVDPVVWHGQEFPLLAFVTDATQRRDLSTGERVVYLVDRDCGSCKTLLRDLDPATLPPTARVIDVKGGDDGADLPHVAVGGVRVANGFPWAVHLSGGRVADVLYSPTATSHLGFASHSRSTASAGLFSGV